MFAILDAVLKQCDFELPVAVFEMLFQYAIVGIGAGALPGEVGPHRRRAVGVILSNVSYI